MDAVPLHTYSFRLESDNNTVHDYTLPRVAPLAATVVPTCETLCSSRRLGLLFRLACHMPVVGGPPTDPRPQGGQPCRCVSVACSVCRPFATRMGHGPNMKKRLQPRCSDKAKYDNGLLLRGGKARPRHVAQQRQSTTAACCSNTVQQRPVAHTR